MRHAGISILLASLALAATGATPRSLAGTGSANYELTLLPALGGARSRAQDINDAGQVCGWANNAAGQVSACLWTDGSPEDLGDLGGHNSIAYALNNSGQVCGDSATSGGPRQAFLWTPTHPNAPEGNLSPLPLLAPGRSSFASGINDAGVVCGWAENSSGIRRAVLWRPDQTARRLGVAPQMTIVVLPLPSGATGNSAAWALNDAGIVAGNNSSGALRLYIWRPTFSEEGPQGETHEVQDRPLPDDSEQITVTGVTDEDTVIVNGVKSDGVQIDSRGFQFGIDQNDYTPYPWARSQDAVNDEENGTAVGSSREGDAPASGTVIQPGAKTPEILEGPTGVRVTDAQAINEDGAIAVNTSSEDGAAGGVMKPKTLGIVVEKRAYRGGVELEYDFDTVVNGEHIVYTILVRNESQENITTPITIRDHLPDGVPMKRMGVIWEPQPLRFREAHLNPGFYGEFGGLGAGQSITCHAYFKILNVRNVRSIENTAIVQTIDHTLGKDEFVLRSSRVRDASLDVESLFPGQVKGSKAAGTVRNRLAGDSRSNAAARNPGRKVGTLPGPMYLILDDLKGGKVRGGEGATTTLAPKGSPYIRLKQKNLPPGKTIKVNLRFQPDGKGGPISFRTRFAIGPDRP